MYSSRSFRAVVSIFGVVFSTLSLVALGPGIVHAADLLFEPPAASGGLYTIGQIFAVPVVVSTKSGEAINAISSNVSFSPQILQLVSIDKNGTIVDFWIGDSTFSNAEGTAQFEGGVYNPGFTGSSGKIVNLIFKARAAGTANLSFASATVLANDGRGTNVLGKTGTVSINIIAATPAESVAPGPEVALFSASHPDQSKWYGSREVAIGWRLPAGTLSVRTGFDSNPSGVPTTEGAPSMNELNFTVPEGVSYFHLQVRDGSGWGKVTHYKIQVESGELAPPVIDPLPKTIVEGSSLTISGTAPVDSVVRVKVIESTRGEGTQSVKTDAQGRWSLIWGSYLNPDLYTITAQYVSSKGAQSPVSHPVTIQISPSALVRIGWPILSYITIGFVAVMLLALIIVWLFYLTYRVRTYKRWVKASVKHADQRVHARLKKLEDTVIDQVRILRKEGIHRKLTPHEVNILDTLAKHIEEAEDDIENEITSIGR